MLQFVKHNWFVLGLATVIIVSITAPAVGVAAGLSGLTRDVLVLSIFIITGMTLPTETILKRLANVKLHIFLQGYIFIVVPAVFFGVVSIFSGTLPANTIAGLYAVAAIPTTVSSCIVFTQANEGNVVAATFNAALANIAGIFVSPLILSLMLSTAGRSMPIEELLGILRSLALSMLLPIIVGQFLRRGVRRFVDQHKKILRSSTNAFLIGVVFLTVSSSVASGQFDVRHDGVGLSVVLIAVLHIVLLSIAYVATRILRFDRQDRIAALFVAPQKTIALGVPLLALYFRDDPAVFAAAIFPLSFYHFWQMIVASVLSGWFRKEATAL